MMPDSVSLAVMIFKVIDSTVSLQKVSGSIPCDEATIGTYRFEIINDRLTMHLISDECIARSHSLEGTYYETVK